MYGPAQLLVHRNPPCAGRCMWKTLEQVLLVLRNLHGTSVQARAGRAHVQCQICLNHLTPGHAPDQEFPSG